MLTNAGIRSSLTALAALLGVTCTFAQDSTPPPTQTFVQQTAYRSSVAEEAVRKQTDKIQAEIASLVADLKLNGIDAADLALLSNASSNLKTMSDEDMQKVVSALQSASMNSQDLGRQQSLVTAYEGQKDVSLRLKSLAVDMAAQESQREIPAKLENLIVRQSANLRETSNLPADTNPDQLNAKQKITHAVVTAEQTAIGGEIDLLLKVLAAKPDAPPDSGVPDTTKDVLDAMNSSSLEPALQAATLLTSAGPFPAAAAKQNSVRDLLMSILRTAMAKFDAMAQLEKVKDEVRQITNDQRDLATNSQQAKLDGSILAERQAKIEDRSSITQALLKSLSPAAFNQLAQAEQDMEKSSAALVESKNPADSAPQQKTVIDALIKTANILDEQIAAAEKEQSASPTDKLAQLQKLQSEINQAQQNPQAPEANLQKLQQDAAAVSPPAANKIADATDQLQQPQPDTNAAQQSLADASKIVQQEEDALKQSAQDYQALQQASKLLQNAQQQAATADQAMQQNSTDLTQAAKDLTQAQANIAQIQQNANQAGVPQDAQKALQQAGEALKQAAMQAVQAKGADAQSQNQKAMSAMQQAQSGMGKAMAQLQQQSQGKGMGQGMGQGKPGPSTMAGGKAGGSQAPKQGGGVLTGTGAGGTAQVVGGLTPKDRDAITQFQAEKSPPEYAPLVQQYLKNLADASQSQ